VADDLDHGGAAAWRASRGIISQVAASWESALVDPVVRGVVEPAPDAPALAVSVCFATAADVWERRVRVPPGAVVAQAVWLSGLLADFPNTDLSLGGIGIFGHVCGPYDPLEEGDRLEVYRPLHFDPQESRFRRVAHKAKLLRQQKSGRR
jgi:putative ubiquitin-RnfH superfamily antitoxin RatB of RatAB toxin-antitoxin module